MGAGRTKRWRRRALLGLGAPAAAAGLWVTIHEVPGAGPALAEGARALVGPEAVAFAEDLVYGAADRVRRVFHRNSAPVTFWTPEAAPAPGQPGPANAPAPASSFPPPPFPPPFPGVQAPSDGAWVSVPRPGDEGGAVLAKSLVHPDPKRSFAAVAVVAVDLRRVDLALVAGTDEPKSAEVPPERRHARVPEARHDDLLAVFNGGFRTMHGNYGMMVDGDTFVPPRPVACTVALYRDGTVGIATHERIAGRSADMRAYRQTPPCLVEGGAVNAALAVEYTRKWGSTVSGSTVIRRSAVGVDATGRTLFYGLGEAVTARALAVAMRAVGAVSAAQLDVNHAYPRFLFYARPTPTAPPAATEGLIPDVKFASWEYVREPALRDFFYLARKRDRT